MSDLELVYDDTPELNITPLVDVMLVLLAILMVSTPVIVFEENITLPNGSKTKSITKKVNLDVVIDHKRVITFQKNTYSFNNFANNFLLATNGISKESVIYISADKRIKYGDVMFILKSIKEAGFLKVSLVTDG